MLDRGSKLVPIAARRESEGERNRKPLAVELESAQRPGRTQLQSQVGIDVGLDGLAQCGFGRCIHKNGG